MIRDETIIHLGHSGTLIKMCGRTLIFDYATWERERRPGQGIREGFIDPDELRDEHVTVFVSHHHPDHFVPDIFHWREVCPSIRYVVSGDVQGVPEDVMTLESDWRGSLGDLDVVTYPSTDIGLAYSVFINGRHIYFCGDNAYWNWDDEASEKEHREAVLGRIRRNGAVEIGFQVCDPRLDKWGAGGIYLFAEVIHPMVLVPVHSFGNYRFNRKVAETLKGLDYGGSFWPISRRGAAWCIDQSKETDEIIKVIL